MFLLSNVRVMYNVIRMFSWSFWSGCRSSVKVLKSVSQIRNGECLVLSRLNHVWDSFMSIYLTDVLIFLMWLRPVCNWWGVFWNRNGPRCTRGWAGGGRRPQCDPNGEGVCEGQPICPRGGLRGHWQSCRYPGFYPQTHGWYRVSSGIYSSCLVCHIGRDLKTPVSNPLR